MQIRELTETRKVKIKDAEFTIGFIPRRIWKDLIMRLSALDILKYKNIGSDKFDIKSPEFKKSQQVMDEVYWQMVQCAVKGHSDLLNSNGKAIPFVSKDGKVSDDIMDIYDLNSLIYGLGKEIMDFNTLSEDDKKN